MSGWLLILAMLVLGGVLSTLGDRLGSMVGKARLSLFNLRPRKTAVVITALTGSVISAVSLGLMLLVSARLRVGLFELDQIQNRLQQSRNALRQSKAELRHSAEEQRHSLQELSRSRDDLQRAQRGRQQAMNGREEAMASQRKAEGQLSQAQARVSSLRRELQPLQNQRQRLEAERDRLSHEVQGRDAEIQRTETELAGVRRRIAAGEQELKGLETNLLALRRGDVVIASGQPLATAKVKLANPGQAKAVIDSLLQRANLSAFQRVLPGKPADRQILMVPRSDIDRLESLLRQNGTWVVSIRSAGNVLRGETRVLAFPELRPNRQVVHKGEQLARTILEAGATSPEEVRSRLNLLLAAAFTKVQRQGTLVDGLQFDVARFNALGKSLSERPANQAASLEAIAINDADTPDPIVVDLHWSNESNSRHHRP